LTHLGKEELLFRHNAIVGGLAGLVSSPIGMALSMETSASKAREFLIAWIVGSLEGPATA
jgi:hypothetical protein